jgi:hypothetical protein
MRRPSSYLGQEQQDQILVHLAMDVPRPFEEVITTLCSLEPFSHGLEVVRIWSEQFVNLSLLEYRRILRRISGWNSSSDLETYYMHQASLVWPRPSSIVVHPIPSTP